MSSGNGLDRLARDLASGEISRRAALRRLAGAAIGIGAASLPGAQPLAAATSKRCPSSRRCGEKCCPKHAHCRRGKCKCNSGYTKCGNKCFDLQTNANHCGDCDTVCPEGRACIDGQCAECSTAADCPGTDGGICGGPTCTQGVCGNNYNTNLCAPASCSGGVEYDPSYCDGAGNCPPQTQHSCGAYACNGTTCYTQCSNDTQCRDPNVYTCNGNCEPDCLTVPALCTPQEFCHPQLGCRPLGG